MWLASLTIRPKLLLEPRAKSLFSQESSWRCEQKQIYDLISVENWLGLVNNQSFFVLFIHFAQGVIDFRMPRLQTFSFMHLIVVITSRSCGASPCSVACHSPTEEKHGVSSLVRSHIHSTEVQRVLISFFELIMHWFGLKGLIVSMVVLALQAVILYRQRHARMLRGEPTPPRGVIFANSGMAVWDTSFVDMLKFFLDYGFYKFGLEVSTLHWTLSFFFFIVMEKWSTG